MDDGAIVQIYADVFLAQCKVANRFWGGAKCLDLQPCAEGLLRHQRSRRITAANDMDR